MGSWGRGRFYLNAINCNQNFPRASMSKTPSSPCANNISMSKTASAPCIDRRLHCQLILTISPKIHQTKRNSATNNQLERGVDAEYTVTWTRTERSRPERYCRRVHLRWTWGRPKTGHEGWPWLEGLYPTRQPKPVTNNQTKMGAWTKFRLELLWPQRIQRY